MGLSDILQKYANTSAPSSSAAHGDFDAVARELSPQALGDGVAGAFRSEQTPPFGDMVGQMFGQSNPQQQAGVLNQILGSIGPGVLSGIAGGVLGRILGGGAGTVPTISPQQASQLTPEQVSEIAAHAQTQDPSIVDRVGGFYAEHPQLVKSLGAAALAIVMGRLASRNRG